MSELDRARAEIDKIDREMRQLFQRRMAAAGRIAQYKKKKDLPVLDAGREKEVLDDRMAGLKDPALEGYYASFLSHVMFLSRRYQTCLLGSAALACRDDEADQARAVLPLYPGVELLPTATHRDVFEAVEAGDAAMGLVPFGDGKVLDLCYSYMGCHITGMVELAGASEPRRCLVLGSALPAYGDHVALVVTVENRVGRLAEVTEALSAEGLETEMVTSRPTPEETGEYYYYIQLACPGGPLEAEGLAQRISQVCGWCRVLGIFEMETVAA